MRWLYALLVPAIFFAFACSSEDPTGVTQVPIKPSFSLSCSGIPNGGIVGVTQSPETATIDRSLNSQVRIDAKVWRDDPNTPGVQFYCYDTGPVMHFYFLNPPRVASAISGPDTGHPQYTIAKPGYCPGGGSNCNGPAIVAGNYSSFWDTTTVTVVP